MCLGVFLFCYTPGKAGRCFFILFRGKISEKDLPRLARRGQKEEMHTFDAMFKEDDLTLYNQEKIL